MRDTKERYGSLSRIFHWSMAFLIGWQVLKFLDRIDDGEHWVGQTLVPWHVSIGTLLLLLVVLRVVWAAKQKDSRPEPDPTTASLVRLGHSLLYVGMVLMPITGILAVLGGGHAWTVFGVELVSKGDKVPWMISLGGLHSPIAWMLTIMIAGHIGLALLHHAVRKDGLLRRMV